MCRVGGALRLTYGASLHLLLLDLGLGSGGCRRIPGFGRASNRWRATEQRARRRGERGFGVGDETAKGARPARRLVLVKPASIAGAARAQPSAAAAAAAPPQIWPYHRRLDDCALTQQR